jgi:hypothetical protein
MRACLNAKLVIDVAEAGTPAQLEVLQALAKEVTAETSRKTRA